MEFYLCHDIFGSFCLVLLQFIYLSFTSTIEFEKLMQ